MSEKIEILASFLLLAMLLASGIAVPAAGAGGGIDLDRYVVPDLKENESIETIAVSGVLTLQPEWDGSGTTGIPFGSIIVHTADGRTLVFDKDGNHLLSISDDLSAKVPTPGGVEKPCTWLHQLPNDSRVYHRDNGNFVLDTAGNLILTVINEHPPSDEDPITINITSPGEGAECWIDVVPPHIIVSVEVHAPLGVRSVNILSGTEGIRCGNGTEFACFVSVFPGENAITVVAWDNRRHRAEKTVNVTVHIGIPSPPAIVVSGRVMEKRGSPVPGALVRFESALTLDGEPLLVTTATEDDGGYLIEGAPGYRQTITVEKEGYSPLRREVVFENLTNELDLELEPLPRTAPGFGPAVGVLSLMGALLILPGRKRQ